MTFILTACILLLCVFASNAGSWGTGTIYVCVSTKNPVVVTVDGNKCPELGSGLYRIKVSIGKHRVYVSGISKDVYVSGVEWISF